MKRGVLAAVGAAAAATVLASSPAYAAAPPISMGSAQAVATLPSGCTADDFHMANWTDGSYHGYVQATCNSKPELFYVQRDPAGTWALRSTTIDMPNVYAVTVDNTGTYFVGERANGDLTLVRRNNDGSLSQVHVLDSGNTPVYDVSVVAQGGNYWVVWDHVATSHEGTDTAILQATTMAPAVPPSHIAALRFSPSLVLRGSESPQLFVCYLPDTGPDPDEAYIGTMTEKNHVWSGGDQENLPGCNPIVEVTGLQGSYFNGHTYLIDDNWNKLYSDVSGALADTGVPADTVLGLTGTRVAAINGNDVYTQNSDGSFPSSPTGTMTAAPVPVHQTQIINRSGKLIRLFVQKDSAGNPGTRLLQQVQQ